MYALARPVIALARPKVKPRSKVKAKDIKRAIDQAKLLCLNFEDTIECRLAWETVEELSIAYNDQKYYEQLEVEAEDNEERRRQAREREYDV